MTEYVHGDDIRNIIHDRGICRGVLCIPDRKLLCIWVSVGTVVYECDVFCRVLHENTRIRTTQNVIVGNTDNSVFDFEGLRINRIRLACHVDISSHFEVRRYRDCINTLCDIRIFECVPGTHKWYTTRGETGDRKFVPDLDVPRGDKTRVWVCKLNGI